MTRSLELLTLLLPTRDREVVLGDLCESGQSLLRAHFELAGLIGRRCLPPYMGLGDGLGLAFACLLGSLLGGLGVAFFAQTSREMSSATATGMLEILRLSAMLCMVAVAAGLVVVSRARTIAALMMIALLLPAIYCAIYSHGLQIATLFVFVIPGGYGAWFGARIRGYEGMLLLLTLVTLISGPSIFSNGQALLRALLLSTPALYCWSIRHSGVDHVRS